MFYWLYDILHNWLRANGLYDLNIFRYVTFRTAMAILMAAVMVVMLGPRVIRMLVRMRMGDIPDFNQQRLNQMLRNKSNVPTGGGVLICGAIILSTALWARMSNFYVLLAMIGMLWLAVLGGVDDWLKIRSKRRGGGRNGLHFHEKILFQIALAMMVAFFAYRYGEYSYHSASAAEGLLPPASYNILNLPFWKHPIVLSLGVYMIVSVFVMTGSSNAVNLTDGMDGLASGCMGLVGFVLMVLAFLGGTRQTAEFLFIPWVPGAEELSVFAGAIVGACVGFLWHNCYPAKMFMGDTGSLPLGGAIGYIAIILRQEVLLLLVGGVFAFEAISVMLQVGVFKATKKRNGGEGKRLFLCAPFHHHLHMKGWSEPQVVVRLWLVGAVLAAVGLATLKMR
jgi:phospho-N-acetylmuramoyl-pentapeptide-transferase